MHLSKEGLEKIVAIKASFNKSLSSKLEVTFPNNIPVDRPLVQNLPIPSPQWLAGFTSGEGCFYVKVFKSNEGSIGFNVNLTFQLTQHIRDEELMRSFLEYFDYGNIYKKKEEAFDFKVTKFTDNYYKIIPFFNKYTIHVAKSKDFEDFCKVAEIINKKRTFNWERIKSNTPNKSRNEYWNKIILKFLFICKKNLLKSD